MTPTGKRRPQAEVRWICENPDCLAEFAEYVNGCPRCYEGRRDAGLVPLHFSVRVANAERLAKEGKS